MKRTVLLMLKEAAIKYAKTGYVYDMSDKGWIGKTYAETEIETDHIASGLINYNFLKNDKISLISEGRINWVTAEFSILKAGCISVPLSIKLLPEEILFRINHSESKAIIASHNTIEKIVPIWNKIEHKEFKIIYLDNDFEYLAELDKTYTFNPSTNVILFSKLTEEGKNSYNQNHSKLKEIESQTEEDDVVTISYTSGTTGNPKGIMLTHLNYWANSHDSLNFFKLTEYFRTLLILPLDHSFAHTVGLYISLIDGLGIYFVDARGGSLNTLKNIPVNLKDVSPDFLLTVPALTGNFMKKIIENIDSKGGFVKWLFHTGLTAGEKINGNGFKKAGFVTKLLNYIPYKLADLLIFKKVRPIFGKNLQFCVGGGALLDIRQQRFFYTIGVPIFQGYGLTEASPIISANCDHTHKLGSSGKIIPGVECKIIKSDGTEAKTGEKGEIVIRGLNVMKGYYKNEKASQEVLRDGLLYTGDMGYMDEDNFLVVVGREKALLISQDGEKYSPEGIEEAIANSSDFINQVMLYNDHSRFTSALITVDEGRIKRYAEKYEISSPEDMLEVLKKSFYQFKHEKEYKNIFPEKWIPSVFRIVPEQFTEQNQMINSTLKMVRYKITEVYKYLIDDMYSSDDKQVSLNNNEILKKIIS